MTHPNRPSTGASVSLAAVVVPLSWRKRFSSSLAPAPLDKCEVTMCKRRPLLPRSQSVTLTAPPDSAKPRRSMRSASKRSESQKMAYPSSSKSSAQAPSAALPAPPALPLAAASISRRRLRSRAVPPAARKASDFITAFSSAEGAAGASSPTMARTASSTSGSPKRRRTRCRRALDRPGALHSKATGRGCLAPAAWPRWYGL
mmetsp:Transcript_97600/g.259280  ORF Transcript_97600/g.259280 Transcript_97600/m.259280 type:complete len:202 (+) Transcript_97600:448-1053(+)